MTQRSAGKTRTRFPRIGWVVGKKEKKHTARVIRKMGKAQAKQQAREENR